MINIKGLDKAKLLVELYNRSHQQGMGMFQRARNLTVEDARQLLEQSTYFDYLYGKVMKVDLSSDEEFSEWLYDRDNGQGAAQEVVDKLRKEMERNLGGVTEPSINTPIKTDKFLENIETDKFLEKKPIENFIEKKPISNLIDPEPKNIMSEGFVPNINVDTLEAKTQSVDLNNAYIGVYEIDGEYRVGLFQKTEIKKSELGPLSAQYYQDVLSDTTVALMLNKNGQDRKCDFSQHLLNDPEERVNWNGIRGTISREYTEYYKLPPVTGEVDRHLSLVQFTSVYPELQGNVSIETVIGCLADYCSKFELKATARAQIVNGLKSTAKYLIASGKPIPNFTNLKLNEVDLSTLPEDFNTNKRR